MTEKDFTVVIAQDELEKLYKQQEIMREQIKSLNACLINYDKKWSSIVKNVIKENAALKSQNKKLKKKITSIKSITALGNVDSNFIHA